MADIERIVIVGGGIAGLSAATALHRHALTRSLWKRSTASPTIGAERLTTKAGLDGSDKAPVFDGDRVVAENGLVVEGDPFLPVLAATSSLRSAPSISVLHSSRSLARA